jgi:parallel beta-helix repeat protein
MIKIILLVTGLVFATTAGSQAKTTVLVPYGDYMIVVPSKPGIYANAFAGSDLAEQIKTAIAALPNSSGIVKVASGTYSITSGSIVIPSNITVVCDPGVVIEVGDSIRDMALVSMTNATNFALENCIVDGNRLTGTKSLGLIQMTDSSHGTLSGNVIRNSYGNGLYLWGGNTQIKITNNDIYNNGPTLDSGQAGLGIGSGSPGAAANTYISIGQNKVHDNWIGIEIQPSLTATTNFDISNNEIYSNANDGLLVFSVNMNGGPISNFTIASNQSYCNGWPANGVNFSPNCTPGFLQHGSVVSSSGVGIDLNSASFGQSTITGNSTHDNFYEGIDVTPLTITQVNTNGTVVTAVSGDPFITSWKPNQAVIINGAHYLIASISGTTQMTLTTSAGAQNMAPFLGVGNGQNTLSGNTSYNNGSGNNIASGHGFGDIANGDIWVNNVAYNNSGVGFIDQLSSNVSHTGDTAYNNDNNGGFSTGFLCQGCLNATYTNLTAYDSRAAKKQVYGLVLDSQANNARIRTINMPQGGPPILDQGTNDVYTP